MSDTPTVTVTHYEQHSTVSVDFLPNGSIPNWIAANQSLGHEMMQGVYDLHRRGSGVWVGQGPCDNCDGKGRRALIVLLCQQPTP